MNIEDFEGIIGRIHREELRSVWRKGDGPNVAALERYKRNLGLCRESRQQEEEACQDQQRTRWLLLGEAANRCSGAVVGSGTRCGMKGHHC
jgi:hypothetical protein